MRIQSFALLQLMLIKTSLATSCDTLILKTCAGWALGRYPEVKVFIYEDSKHFASGFSVDLAGGGNPRLVCIKDQVETITEVHKLTRLQLRAKVIEMGYPALETLSELQDKVTSEL